MFVGIAGQPRRAIDQFGSSKRMEDGIFHVRLLVEHEKAICTPVTTPAAQTETAALAAGAYAIQHQD